MRSRSAASDAARSATAAASRVRSSCAPPGRASHAVTAAARSRAAYRASRSSAPASPSSDSTTSHGGIAVPSRQARIPAGSRRRNSPYQPAPGSSLPVNALRY
ncbi:hypothetical protein OHU17_08440 [Streptomyces goshikiensis]|uniref:Uncharacterized protein n=1 Tax=Streptomyces goshikiensis TaxID=1942 RepID=A0ABZ1RI89_9ACTN|nr:hypothetical protein [Streptomyces goshikiensis]